MDGSGLSGIDAAQAFDWIIAYHVIEHSPDLVRFLQDCSRLLKPSGVLSLAVPDKRYCFDYFQSLTSTGMVLDAYWSGRQRHSPGNMFDTYVNHVSKGGVIAWSPTSDGKLATVHTLQEVKELTSCDRTSDHYVDAHAWRFTPSSFALTVLDLFNMDLTDLAPTDQADSYGFEFFITLKKGFRPNPIPRLDLLSRIKSELDQP